MQSHHIRTSPETHSQVKTLFDYAKFVVIVVAVVVAIVVLGEGESLVASYCQIKKIKKNKN